MKTASLLALSAVSFLPGSASLPSPAPVQGSPVYFVVAEPSSPVHGDSYVVPISDPALLREARDVIHGLNGVATIAVCRITVPGDGINRDVLASGEPLWSWHVMEFLGCAETTQETLDGWPGLVESNPYVYIQSPPSGDNTGLIGFWTYSITQELGPGPGISPPTSPTGPTLTKLSGGQVRVSWTDRSNNEEGFEVQREKKVGNFYTDTTLLTTGPNTTTYTDAPGSGTFRYRVRSFNIAGSSIWTAWKSIKN